MSEPEFADWGVGVGDPKVTVDHLLRFLDDVSTTAYPASQHDRIGGCYGNGTDQFSENQEVVVDHFDNEGRRVFM